MGRVVKRNLWTKTPRCFPQHPLREVDIEKYFPIEFIFILFIHFIKGPIVLLYLSIYPFFSSKNLKIKIYTYTSFYTYISLNIRESLPCLRLCLSSSDFCDFSNKMKNGNMKMEKKRWNFSGCNKIYIQAKAQWTQIRILSKGLAELSRFRPFRVLTFRPRPSTFSLLGCSAKTIEQHNFLDHQLK